jgi:putative SOS response-associated peptidase YedK
MQTHNTNVFNDSYLAPSYNAAPQSFQPVVRLDRETGKRELTVMRWGLIPYWPKDEKNINARAEIVTASPAFREAMIHRRCLIPADWFYEWQKIDTTAKQLYAIGLRATCPFAFAGLWERWRDSLTGQALETYTVITTDPNELMEQIHDRMPVILKREDYSRWLAYAEPSHLPIDLLRTFPAEQMKAWKVQSRMWERANRVRRDC